MDHRLDFINGLRKMADFFEAHPEVPTPGGQTFNVFVAGRKEMAEIARTLGPAEKLFDDTWFMLRKNFSGMVTVDFNAYREKVCRRVVIGTELVEEQIIPARAEEIIPAHEVQKFEWQCDEPLLASGGDQ